MSENMEKLNELKENRSVIEAGGGEALVSKIHGSGRLTARERITGVLDDSSFVEFGAFVKQRTTDFNAQEKQTPADGVVTGYGTVDGKLVFIYSQDSTVLGGSVGEMHARKICSIYDQAMKMGAPVIGILDSAGMRVQEGVDALDAYGKIFKAMAGASGIIPQISVVLGDCMGSGAFIPSLSDFVFMTEKNARLFMVSPVTLPGEAGKSTGYDAVGSAKALMEENGLVHFTYATEAECLSGVKELLDYLPSNNMEDAPFVGIADDINREDAILNECIPENDIDEIDLLAIIQTITDGGRFMEVQKSYTNAMLTGFARFNGYTAGIVGNRNGLLCSKGTAKATAFITFCDAFNIPIVTLTDIKAYRDTVEQGMVIKNTAKMINAFMSATVPKINIILRNGIGNPYLAMNSKHIGADVVFSWPAAKVALMDAEAAVNVMYADELAQDANFVNVKQEKIDEYNAMQASPYRAASRGFIDDIIEPAATRKRVIAVLEMLASKRESKPTKKHSSITL